MGRPNTSEKQPYITPKLNPSKVQNTCRAYNRTFKTGLTANFGQFWPNLYFRKAGSWTTRNLKFCTKHDWWSIRPPSKFHVKIACENHFHMLGYGTLKFAFDRTQILMYASH